MSLFALMLAILVPNQPVPPVRAAEARGIAQDLKTDPDAARIAAHPGLARRDGRLLQVGTLRFFDQGAACDGSGCERFRFDRPWFDGFVGVRHSDDENGDYLLVSLKNGFFRPVGGKPHPSPSGRYFFVGIGSDANDETISGLVNGSYVWRVDGFEPLRTVHDTIVSFETFVGWHGDDCVEFTGFQNYGTGSTSHHYWLLHEPLDWTLHDAQPPSCSAR